ncbi:MAG TPA: glycosyltransferase family 9 protein [bacterium]|nr:glycosyltransferase family 9 protein [bacterium]HPP29515.1 glycosyltransferase family 9 protein [bacterium]
MEKVLVIRYGGVGDVITVLPVIQSLKNSGYSVILASNNRYKEFCLKYTEVDGFVGIDNSFLLSLFAGERNEEIFYFLQQFNLILSYTDEEEVFSRMLRSLFKGKVVFKPVNPEKIKNHIVKYLLEPVYEFTSKVSEIPVLKINSDVPKEFFAIHPGSGSYYKNWAKERFMDVYKELSVKMRGIVLLGYAEMQQCEFWYENIASSDIVVSERLEEVVHYIERTHFYIGNDSGISHLFAAGGVPSIVIFGPTSPFIWSPSGENVRILYKKEKCSPCSIEQRRLCKEKKCLNSITVKDVLKEVETLWRKI